MRTSRTLLLLLLVVSSMLGSNAQTTTTFAFDFANTPQGGWTEVLDIAVDASKNRYITGWFKRTVDMNPQGSSRVYHRSRGAKDIFVAKYDSSGVYQWSFSIGSESDDEGHAIHVDADGYVYIGGSAYGQAGGVDFDPGSGTTTLNGSQSFGYVAKYTSSGSFQWAFAIDAAGTHSVDALTCNTSGNIVVAGRYQSTTDFDPGSGTSSLTPPSGVEMFFATYSSGGELSWAKRLAKTASTDSYVYCIATDADDNIYVGGGFRLASDFDPDTGTTTLTPAGSNDAFFAKYTEDGALTWAKHIGAVYNDLVYGIAVDADGDVVIAGGFEGTVDFDPGTGTQNMSTAATVNSDIFLARYDSDGAYLWSLRAGAGGVDEALDLVLDGSSNAYITGYFDGTVDFDPGTGTASKTGSYDIFYAKYNSSGGHVWSNALSLSGGSSSAINTGSCIALDTVNDVYIGGMFMGNLDFDPSSSTTAINNANGTSSDTSRNAFHARYTSSGSFVNVRSVGGLSMLAPNEVRIFQAVDDEGNIYVTGSVEMPVDFDPSSTVNMPAKPSNGANDGYLAKYNASGQLQWVHMLGSNSWDDGLGLAIDTAGNVVIVGQFANTMDIDPSSTTVNLVSAGNLDCFVAKFSPSGSLLWGKRFGGTGLDQLLTVAIDNNNDIYVGGIFAGTVDFDPGTGSTSRTSSGSSDGYIAKYDQSGNFVWVGTFGSTGTNEAVTRIDIDSEGNVVYSGNFSGSNIDFDYGTGTATLSSTGTATEAFFSKITPSSSYQWVKHIAGTSIIRARSLCIGENDDVIITGDFVGTADFDPSTSTYNLTASASSSGTSDAFVAVYSSTGAFEWATQFGVNSEFEVGTDVTTDQHGNLYCSGWYRSSSIDVDPGSGTTTLTNVGGADMYLVKLSPNGSHIWSESIAGTADDFAGMVTVDNSANIVLVGTYWSRPLDADVTSAVQELYADNNNAVILKIGQEFTITASAGTGGSITPSGATVVDGGDSQVFSISPNSNYCVSNVIVDDVSQGAITSYTFSNITKDHTISATFSQKASFTSCMTDTIVTGPTNETSAGTCQKEVLFSISASAGSTLWYTTTGALTTSLSLGTGSGLTYPMGTTTVTVFAVSACDTATCTFDITVDDVTAPVPNVATLPTATGECSVTLTAPTANDNCAGTITATTTDPTSYTSQGTYSVTWTYDDGNGNTSTQSQTVVVDDVTAPVPNVATLPTATGDCSVTLTAPTANDNCAGTITATTTDPTSYTSQGTYSVTWTYADGNGNTSTQSQTVVVDDVTAPVPDSPSLSTITHDCYVTLIAPTATDACAGTITATTSSPLTYTSQGSYSVIWTYNDGNGNSTTQTQNVVIDDNTAPDARCKNLEINLTGTSVSITADDINDGSDDACGVSSISVSPSTFTSADVGDNEVTLTVTDVNGNSATCTATVTVFSTSTCDVTITSVPSNSTFTGGNPNILYLGYGPQSTTLQTAVEGGTGHTYEWAPTTGLSSTAVASPVFTPTSAGTYTFEVTVTSSSGCSATASESICVLDIRVPNQSGKIYLCHGGNTLSVNANAAAAHIVNHPNDKLGSCSASCGDGWARSVESVHEEFDLGEDDAIMRVQPNPFTQGFSLYFEGDVNDRALVEVYDLQGQRIDMIRDLTPGRGWVLGEEFKTGVYMLHFHLDGYRAVRKIIKID